MTSTLINLLTLSRILLCPFIFILIVLFEYYWSSLFLFFLAGISDYFDGYFARKYQSESVLGEMLDPIADKVLIIFLLFALSISLSSSYIAFVGAIIITREVWVGGLRDLNARRNISSATKVTFIAKVKTTIQLFTITIYLLGLSLNNMLIILIGDIFLLISLLITLYTGIIYTYNSFNSK